MDDVTRGAANQNDARPEGGLGRPYRPSGFALVRTPLLPIDELSAWTDGLRSTPLRDDDPAFDEAVAHDAALLRERLARLVARPEIAEAIFLASPDLVESIDAWRRDPDSKKARRTEQGLVRYLLRMIARPAPFGLFAGCAPASIAPHTQLLFGDRFAWRRHSRLDMDYLFALCEEVVRDHAVRAALTFRPNATLYEAAGRLRFAEWRVHGRRRKYQLVAVDSFDCLRTALDCAAEGTRLDELAQALVTSHPDGGIPRDDAESFLHDLVDNQLLVPDFGVPLTGEEATSDLLRQLRGVRVAWAVCARLEQASALLREIDDGGLGAAPERYRELAQILEPLGVPVAASRLVQVDLTRAAAEPVAIGEAIVDETLRAIDVLAQFPRTRERALDEFRAAFVDRYGSDREIPLLEALDEECGIGFDRSPMAGVAASPLLAGLPFQDRHDATRVEWGGEEAAMLRVYARALADHAHEIELTDDDLKLIARRDTPPLPDALHAMVTVVAPSAEAVDRGEFCLLFHGAMGPSGARMLGRFCHADPAIEAGVRAHLAQEEALAPHAVFAEIVHLPAGRIGNILARPQLRDHEIAFLGRSGAPPEGQIALSDLLVSVRGDRIHLRSKRLGREVIPRLTNAHGPTGESLGVDRFLAALQHSIGLRWNWGPLADAPFLPRVTRGRSVLSRATWRAGRGELQRLVRAAPGAERMRAVRRWREERRMPRVLSLVDGDNELLVDFANPLSVDAFAGAVKKRDAIVLMESFAAPDELCATSAEGRFFHELVIPLVQRATRAESRPALRVVPRAPAVRTFAPGSQWLYAKLYAGSGTADRLLRDEIAPLAVDALVSSAAVRWFFIRSADPHRHVGLRFLGDPDVLRARVQPRIEALAHRAIEGGAIWKFQLDTYEREIGRYGGDEAIELAEEIFFRDSEAVLAMLGAAAGDAGADLRWRMTLLGIDHLLADFGLDAARKLAFCEKTRDALAARYHYEPLRARIAARLRMERTSLLRLLDDPAAAPEELQIAWTAFRRRSQTTASTIDALRTLERQGRLTLPLLTILPSIVHTFVNRATRSAAPEHELVLYDYLVQLYRSQTARSESRATAARR